MPSTADVFVIIPFFQRTAGLLTRAVASVEAQGLEDRCHTIVIDDGSPRSADEELRELPEHSRRRITIIRQANAGAAAARNTGIDAVPTHATAVAFLDSDDVWSSDHLSRGLAALESGADLYFAKTATIGEEESERDGAWPSDVETYGPFTVSDTVRLNDAFLAYTLQRGLPLQTLVVRPELCRSTRFPTHLRRAGEDLTFTFALSCASSLNVFSSRVESLLGKGVNIYRSTLSHGSPDAIPRLLDELQSRLDLCERLRSAPPFLRQVNAEMQAQTLSGLAVQSLHAARWGRVSALRQVAGYLAPRPRVAARFFNEVLRACWKRAVLPAADTAR